MSDIISSFVLLLEDFSCVMEFIVLCNVFAFLQ